MKDELIVGKVGASMSHTHSYYGPWLEKNSDGEMIITDKQAMIRNVKQPKTDDKCKELDALVAEAGVENGMRLDDPALQKLRNLLDEESN